MRGTYGSARKEIKEKDKERERDRERKRRRGVRAERE